MRTKIYYAGDKASIQEIATVIAQEFKLPSEQLQLALEHPCPVPSPSSLSFFK